MRIETHDRDLILIRAFCRESEQDLDIGEMACVIIQRALKAKKLRRKSD